MADGAAAAPRLHELLQRLVGSTTLASSDSPSLPSTQAGCSLPIPPVGGPGTLQGLRARQDLPVRGVGAVGCPWPGTPAGSAAQASAKEAGHLVTACQADTTACRLPGQRCPGSQGLPEQESQSRNGSGLKDGHFPEMSTVPATLATVISLGPEAARSPPRGTLTVYRYCRNRSFWVITNRAFLLFKTRFPNSRART